MLQKIKDAFNASLAWWNSDALAAKSVRVPFKLAIVGAVAVAVLSCGLFAATKLNAYAGASDAPVSVAHFEMFEKRLGVVAGQLVAVCSPPAKVAPVKKTTKRR